MLAALTLVAAGCSRKPPEPVPDENVEEAAPAQPAPPPPPKRVAPPKAAPPVVSDADDEPAPDPSVQTQEDADAVGMTTRAPPPASDEEPAIATTNEALGESVN